MKTNLIKLTKGVLLLCCMMLFLTGTASAAGTAEISPSVSLSFSQIPAGIITGSETDVLVLTNLTPELSGAVKKTPGVTVDNAAYAVSITPKGFSGSDVTTAVIRLPVASEWSAKHANIGAVTITNGAPTYTPVTLIGVNEKDQMVFEVSLRTLPETVLLVSTTGEVTMVTTPTKTKAPEVTQTKQPTPEPTKTPVPLFGMVLGAAGAFLLLKTRRT